VIRDGNVKYVLSYLFDTANMQAKLDRQSLPDTWLLSMFDRAGQRVVRTLDPGKFVMRPPAESLRAMMNRTFEGVAWTTSVEGVSLLTAIARGPRSGWTVALGVPQREILAPLLPSAIWTFIGGLGVTLFALLIATQLARRIARPMERLSRAAVQLGHEAIEAPPRSGVREIDDVGSAMVEAAGKLRRRTEERDSNVEALRELNATLENRVMQRTAELAAANRVLSEEIERRKRLEEALVHSQKLEAVGQLTGGIAHEFNNLLAAVISCFRLVERRTQETSTRELAARGREAGERGARLTQQLLAFSRKQSLNVGSVDLNAVVARMSELMHQTTGGRVHITTATDPNLWKAMADEQQIELCLVNLIFNARDAMPESGEVSIRTANLSVGASDIDELKAGDYVAIEVCDTGSGMDEATLRRAFEPFFTTKDVGKGTGLGLSMVYGTMRQLGGSVRLVSEPGRGTTAALLVPRAAIVSPRVSENRLPSTAHPVGDATVLLTDDDEDVRRFTAQMLVDVGYEVIETSSAPSGLEVLQSNRVVDVMIVDYAMPGMNGREMIERTRALRPHLPIIVFTGYADLPQDIGGLIIVRKPATVEVLAGAIQRCLARPVEDAVARRAHAG
jgi:signal transduction histidine kinase/ActR/RegA family two-component response regulator